MTGRTMPAATGLPTTVFPEQVLYRISDELAVRFRGVFSRDTIDRYLIESYDLLGLTARIGIHLPVLAGRFASERLTALAHIEGLEPKQSPEVLFVCVRNAGRSQLAAALLRRKMGDAVHIRSAGSTPAAELDPTVVAVAAELGMDLGEEVPKPLTDEVVRAADVVVTLGCGDACKVYPGKRYLDWPTDDPEGADHVTVRRIVADIDARIASLLAALIPGRPAEPDRP